MVEVICDTSFLIHLATKKIKNLSNIETEIGSINFVVPQIVIKELKHLLAKNLVKIGNGGENNDSELIIVPLNLMYSK